MSLFDEIHPGVEGRNVVRDYAKSFRVTHIRKENSFVCVGGCWYTRDAFNRRFVALVKEEE